MKHIIIDLEMNEVARDRKKRRGISNETIEIGAVMLDESYREVSCFKTYVKPAYNDIIMPIVKRITGITESMVKKAPEFNEAYHQFLSWCLEAEDELVFYSWSNADHIQFTRESSNKKYKPSPEELQIIGSQWVDFQKLFGQKLGYRNSLGLKDALELTDIHFEGSEHDALDDARNTASLLRLYADKDAFADLQDKIRKMRAAKPVNARATKHAVELFTYLRSVEGKGIITGQHTQTIPMEELSYIGEVTGKQPMLRGYELLAYSPNINYNDASEECLTEIKENEGSLEAAYKWGKKRKGIITFSYHWYSPIGGRDKSFYAVNTDFDPSKILEDGTPEREAFFSDLDAMAALLLPFAKADIPILWRPFHESDGTWFWWGRKGPKVARDLYKLMYHRFVDVYHLDNLLWVWNCAAPGAYPGDEYVDINSIDIYLDKYKATDYAKQYKKLIKATSPNRIVALAEVGYLPDIDMLENSRLPFAYYMCWSKEYCIGEQYNTKEQLKKMYDSSYAITM